eukprot:4407407-Pleurochrysis_carterae.AAC.5
MASVQPSQAPHRTAPRGHCRVCVLVGTRFKSLFAHLRARLREGLPLREVQVFLPRQRIVAAFLHARVPFWSPPSSSSIALPTGRIGDVRESLRPRCLRSSAQRFLCVAEEDWFCRLHVTLARCAATTPRQRFHHHRPHVDEAIDAFSGLRRLGRVSSFVIRCPVRAALRSGVGGVIAAINRCFDAQNVTEQVRV